MKDFVFFINKKGYQIKNFPDKYLVRRMKILNHFNINTIFDVGANIGLYALEMRKLGYKGKILSFEPINSVFNKLELASSKDENWSAYKYALGNEDTDGIINIAGNSFSSSILEMLPTHLKSAPQSKYVAQEKIEIKKLDTVYNNFVGPNDNVMLKIDTQGFEKNVIDGAELSLQKISVLQLELSLVPLYQSEMIFSDMISFLNDKGFQIYSFEDGFQDPKTGRLLQLDGIFVNTNLLNSQL